MAQLPRYSDPIRQILIAMMGVWCALILMPAFLGAFGATTLSESAYKLFSTICHQRPERSLYLMGWKLGVCARCAAIYFSFSGMAVLVLIACNSGRVKLLSAKIAQHSRMVLLAAVGPMLIDVLLNDLGISESTLITRGITGCIFGLMAAPVLIPQLYEALLEILPAFFTRLRYVQKTP